MSSPIDPLFSKEPRRDDDALRRVLAASRAELALGAPVRRWRTQVLWVVAASVGLMLAVAVAQFAAGLVSASHLLARAPMILLLLITCGVCTWGALSPFGHKLQRWSVGLALASAAALVLTRQPPHSAPTLPGWFCTASHVGVAFIPLTVVVLALRDTFFRPLRSIVAGLAVGTTGAFIGELACEQGWQHVARYHLLAWALVAAAALLITKWLKPRSFAP